jgi:hypothetical protein
MQERDATVATRYIHTYIHISLAAYKMVVILTTLGENKLWGRSGLWEGINRLARIKLRREE